MLAYAITSDPPQYRPSVRAGRSCQIEGVHASFVLKEFRKCPEIGSARWKSVPKSGYAVLAKIEHFAKIDRLAVCKEMVHRYALPALRSVHGRPAAPPKKLRKVGRSYYDFPFFQRFRYDLRL